MQQTFVTRCARGSIGYHVDANRQNFSMHPSFKPSKISKILRFLSKPGVTEIFRTFAAEADSEVISDIPQNRHFPVAENFAPE
jgi:acetolactate synthase small subunit